MAKSSKDSRALFPSGKQRAFLERVREEYAVAEIASIAQCSERAVRDWCREKFSMPLATVQKLSARAGVSLPKNVRAVDAYAHIAKASKMGLAAVMQKYGGIPRNEKHRQEQWRFWWDSEGKFKKNPILEPRSIHKPKKGAELAEFIGIMMGDGGLSKYQAIVTLHHTDDLEYASFVATLIKKLFRIQPQVYHLPKKSVNNIVVSRTGLVEYLHELGLPLGNKIKQQFDIPEWIKANKKFSVACLRGLVDTDGSIFTHRYRSKGKWYAYKKLSFTSASEPLRKSVYVLMQELNLHSRMTRDDVRLDSIEDMRQYFLRVNSHNPKHLRRYRNAVG